MVFSTLAGPITSLCIELPRTSGTSIGPSHLLEIAGFCWIFITVLPGAGSPLDVRADCGEWDAAPPGRLGRQVKRRRERFRYARLPTRRSVDVAEIAVQEVRGRSPCGMANLHAVLTWGAITRISQFSITKRPSNRHRVIASVSRELESVQLGHRPAVGGERLHLFAANKVGDEVVTSCQE